MSIQIASSGRPAPLAGSIGSSPRRPRLKIESIPTPRPPERRRVAENGARKKAGLPSPGYCSTAQAEAPTERVILLQREARGPRMVGRPGDLDDHGRMGAGAHCLDD